MSDVKQTILNECLEAFRKGWGDDLPAELEETTRRSFEDFIAAKEKSLEGSKVTLEEQWKADRGDVLHWITFKAEKTKKAEEGAPTVSYGDLKVARNGVHDTEWC
ncbi:MAG: hypothetical protein AAGD01_00220 [Acidobacteriota bacterium]